MSASVLFHGLGLFGTVPALMLAYLQNTGGAAFVMALVLVLHLLGVVYDRDL